MPGIGQPPDALDHGLHQTSHGKRNAREPHPRTDRRFGRSIPGARHDRAACPARRRRADRRQVRRHLPQRHPPGPRGVGRGHLPDGARATRSPASSRPWAPGVTRYQVGDRVGVGCMVDSCGECEFCKDGEEQYCTKGAVMTYNGTGYDGEKTMGGYSQQVVVFRALHPRYPRGHRARRRGAAAVRRHHDLQPAEALGRGPRQEGRGHRHGWPGPHGGQARCGDGRRGDRAVAGTLDKQEDGQALRRGAPLRHEGRRDLHGATPPRSTSSSTR